MLLLSSQTLPPLTVQHFPCQIIAIIRQAAMTQDNMHTDLLRVLLLQSQGTFYGVRRTCSFLPRRFVRIGLSTCAIMDTLTSRPIDD